MRTLMPLAALLAAASPVTAAEIVRLSDATRDAVIAAAANGPEKPAVMTPEQARAQSVLDRSLYPEFWGDDPDGAGPDRRVHGEVTMFAGSGGTFGFSGTAVMPVGQSGTAAVSVMQGTSRWGGIQSFSLGYASNGNSPLVGSGFGPGFGMLGLGPGPFAQPGAFLQPRRRRFR